MKNSSAVPLAPSLLVLGLEEEEIFRNRGCFSLIDLDNNNEINMHNKSTLPVLWIRICWIQNIFASWIQITLARKRLKTKQKHYHFKLFLKGGAPGIQSNSLNNYDLFTVSVTVNYARQKYKNETQNFLILKLSFFEVY